MTIVSLNLLVLLTHMNIKFMPMDSHGGKTACLVVRSEFDSRHRRQVVKMRMWPNG